MALNLSSLGTIRQPFVAALALAVLGGGGVLADRFGLITLPGPSHELVASVLPGAVVALTNNARADQSLPGLTASPLLTRAAQNKADDMAAKSYYAHVSPDGTIPPAWLTAVGYKYQIMGENLVIDRDSSGDVVSAWMGSLAHRENILNPQFTEIGIGVAYGTYEGRDTTYVVQMLAKPFPQSAVSAPKPEAAPKPVAVATPKPLPQTSFVVTPTPVPVVVQLKKPLPVTAKPVKTAATTQIIVNAPEPKAVVADTITPILDSLVSSTSLNEVPSIVASTTYLPPALGASSSVPVVDLPRQATATVPAAPHATIGGALHELASAIAFEIKSFFHF